MNSVLTFLEHHRQRLNLAQYGVQGSLSSVLLTPRFRASSHVVFLILDEEQPEPVLVAKMPRLANATTSLEREAANLQQVQARRTAGFDSIPRLVAFEEYGGRPLLIETALRGRPMDPALVRRQPDRCCQVVSNWLAEIQGSTPGVAQREELWFENFVEQPLRVFTERFPWSAEETKLVERTRELLASLHHAQACSVFEHGDLSHPNLMVMADGKLGVVDWEMATPQGLPAYDLFFFLTYVAFAKQNARTNGDHLAAFRAAFFGTTAWARPWVQQYASALQLSETWLTPLFVVAWFRYIAGLVERLSTNESALGYETATWLRENRYYTLWQYAALHADELRWN
jgi:aminoglycoside phosphotransferase (APT) family kinase protein